MRIRAVACLAALCLSAFALSSCSSTEEESAEPLELRDPALEARCSCGDERWYLYGCAFGPCRRGAGNPENPECRCALPVAGPGAPMWYVHLRSGRSYKGFVRDDNGRTLAFETAGGIEKVFSYDELDPRSASALMRARVAEDDFAGQLRIAEHARAHGYFHLARRHYELAARADPSRKGVVETGMAVLRETAAERELRLARRSFAEGEPGAARRHLLNVVFFFPGESAMENAETLLDKLLGHSATAGGVAGGERAGPIARQLEPARKHLGVATERLKRGLCNTRRVTEAIRDFDEAVLSSSRAYELLSRIEKVGSPTPALLAAAGEMRPKVEEVALDAYLGTAVLELATGSPQKALEVAETALELAPDRLDVRELRVRIEEKIAGVDTAYGWYPDGDARWCWGGYVVK